MLEQPLLLEGEAGVGKTEVARALAAATGSRFVRLQCHEGIDLHHAVYDWDYARQLLSIRAAEAGAAPHELFGREFLLRRPLLEALESDAESTVARVCPLVTLSPAATLTDVTFPDTANARSDSTAGAIVPLVDTVSFIVPVVAATSAVVIVGPVDDTELRVTA